MSITGKINKEHCTVMSSNAANSFNYVFENVKVLGNSTVSLLFK